MTARDTIHTRRITALTFVFLCGACLADETPGLKVPEGFQVTRFAGDDLAHDIFSMTIDSLGRVVVSGPGYVKILIDSDKDGIADRAQTFIDGPASGAQGMFFVGRDLLLAGGEGLIRYRDQDNNDQADGEPDVFLRIKAGNEHDLHAIRKGPDGWWYMIAGNAAGVSPQYAGLPSSPVRKPHAGVILRMKPDLSQGEIFAHGFRNAYDFDFSAAGEVYAFDSDGEKVMSLPWYQPTKLFHVLPGSHQGWVTNDWIRPDYFFDAAPVASAFGRGSPTGVVCYQHTAFPEKYHGALFLQDWTYGRIYSLSLEKNGSTWNGKPEEFVTTTGQFGFAPTDLEVGPGGEMYVCVGGRGTQGGVYCIRPTKKNPLSRPWPGGTGSPTAPSAKLDLCVNAPQPLSSWSRRVWEPVAKELTSEPFVNAAVDRNRSAKERIRAIEILTEKFNGLGGDLAAQLSMDPDPIIRARAAWSLGRTQNEKPNRPTLEPFFSDTDPLVVRAAMEAAQGGDDLQLEEFITPIGQQLANPDRFVRQAAMRVLTRANLNSVHKMAEIAFPKGWRAAIPVAGSFAVRNQGYAGYTIDIALRILKGKYSETLKLEAARTLQLGLGDVTPPTGDLDPVFDGYAPQVDLSTQAAAIDRLGIELASIYPQQMPLVDYELERVIAMIQPKDPALLDKVLSQITTDTSPVDDIHRLIVAARMPVTRTPVQRKFIALALLNLEPKIALGKLQQDSSWDDRVMELCSALVTLDADLPVAMLESPSFGLPGHVQFVQLLPKERIRQCAAVFLRQVQANPNYEWNSDLVYLLGVSGGETEKALLRSKFDDLSLRSAILSSLASEPEEQDRKLFVTGIETGSVETMLQCIEALHLLSSSTDPHENVVLARTLRKLGDRGDERMARDQTIELLRRNLQLQDNYILGLDGDAQEPAISAWLAAAQQRFPDQFAAISKADAQTLAQLKVRLVGIRWENGDATHGWQLFQSRSCTQCHGQRRALGPDLTGVAGRFSRDDLFTAIVFPNQDVSPRYQAVQVMTTDGHVRVGMILYEAVDGLVIRDANNQTYRIEMHEIEQRQTLTQSLMPSGLLQGLSDQDLSDLYAYLRSLGLKSAAVAEPEHLD
ncbi:PVC-type heme-binding CxxCH protein [Planctomicrobium piriforme]|uniref:Putative membrane-bound dehydrogenase domain-containing protein n=1 Tax=Planctomicrobium piriforme TaxID=1576369 RepID=A0A1I3ILQ0_9PLAN|nr:PVC-type heme-binding CxxCH protein [Planctomicrobium piriforme]SFI48925.1 putative membrane-bound dehydrogenase domain-containing protein [Planctomicrobium piriforme]